MIQPAAVGREQPVGRPKIIPMNGGLMNGFPRLGAALLVTVAAVGTANAGIAGDCDLPLGQTWAPLLPAQASLQLANHGLIPCRERGDAVAAQAGAALAFQCDRFQIDLTEQSFGTGVSAVALNQFMDQRFVFQSPKVLIKQQCDPGRSVTLTRLIKLRREGVRVDFSQTWRWRPQAQPFPADL